MGKGIKKETKEYNTFTEFLQNFYRRFRSLSTMVGKKGIKHVAMESTGVYWKPVFNVLNESMEIKLANARHI